jgi:hypothetical protein
VGDVRTTEHRRALPAEALTWALFGGAFVGLAFGWSRTRQEVPVLKNRDEIAWLVGVPVLGTVFSRRATDRPETSSQMWERYTLAGAEFVVVLIVAAYIASFWIDPRFAKTVAADPWLALADMWRRG